MINLDSIRLKCLNIYDSNREIVLNIIGAFGVRGLSLILSLFTMPAYIRYFQDQSVLGIWYTLLSVLNWVLMFDLGLGNGLRNKLPRCLSTGDISTARSYIASTYITTFFIVLVWCAIGNAIIPLINWNIILNVDPNLISNDLLITCIQIVFSGIMIQFVLKLITSILYAVQKSAIVNLLTLISTIIILISVTILPSGTVGENLIKMSYINAIAVNIPLFIATIVIFSTILKNVIPKFSDFKLDCTKEVLHIGVTLLWLQLIFMIISNTNEILISYLTNPESVVQYQAYNKIFNTISSVLTLALGPVWSAVTKASGEGRYKWIDKLNSILLFASIGVLCCEMIVVPFMQVILDLWLGTNIIDVNISYAIILSISNTILFIHNVNTSFANGMSSFKIQFIWMTFAAVINIPLAYILVNITDSWIGVILANIIALIPYEAIQIIYFKRFIRKKILDDKKTNNDILASSN